MPCRFQSPHPGGKFRGIWLGGSPGPHPRGKLRGIWPGTGGLQAYTQGGSAPGWVCSWGSDPEGVCSQGSTWSQGVCSGGGLLPGGLLSGGCLVPGGLCGALWDGYCCGQYASYWNAFLFIFQVYSELHHSYNFPSTVTVSHTITILHTPYSTQYSTALLAVHPLNSLKLHSQLQQPTAFNKAASLLSTYRH